MRSLATIFPHPVPDAAYAALAASAFCTGFSMPVARIFLAVTFVFVLRDAALGRVRLRWTPPVAGWVAYSALAVVVTALVAATLPEGSLIAPAKGLRKTEKLLWFAGALLLPAYATTRERFRTLLAAFAAGSGLYAAAILVGHPVGAWLQCTIPYPKRPPDPGTASAWLLSITDALGLTQTIRDWAATPWRPRTYSQALGKLGGMGQAQRLMAAGIVSLGLWLSGCAGEPAPIPSAFAGATKSRLGALVARLFRATASPWWTALLFGGLVITLKRGALIVFLLVAGIMVLRRISWKKVVPVTVLALALAFALPPFRHRIAQLPDELRFAKGGRILMWTDIAPAMHRRHPWGVGFRGLTWESLRYATENSWNLEKRQNHLHSNIVQVTIELGFLGLAVYLAWMALSLCRASRRVCHGDPVSALPLLLLTSLFLNGIAEYNLIDGETVLLYGLAMGLAATSDDGSSSPSRNTACGVAYTASKTRT